MLIKRKYVSVIEPSRIKKYTAKPFKRSKKVIYTNAKTQVINHEVHTTVRTNYDTYIF